MSPQSSTEHERTAEIEPMSRATNSFSSVNLPGGGGGGGVTPCNGLYPERGTLFRLQVYERIGILHKHKRLNTILNFHFYTVGIKLTD